MIFIIRTINENVVSDTRCPGELAPRAHYQRVVEVAVECGYKSVQLIRVEPNGVEFTIANWYRPKDDTTGLSVFAQVDIKYGYKIHGFKTTCDPIKSANTLKWYESEEAAITAATRMAKKPGNTEALVIYKAIKIVRREDPPIVIEDLD